MNFEFVLQNGVLAQHRTNAYKLFTVLYNDQVIKGPYKDTDARYIKTLERSERLKTWNVPFIVHPIGSTILPYKGENKIFLVFDDLTKPYRPIQFTEELDFVKQPESLENQRYKFLVRIGVIKLNDYFKSTNTIPEWLKASLSHLVLSLIYLNILRVGDMNLSNILIDDNNQKLYIIDYEDTLGTLREDEFFYFNKRPNKDVVEIFKQYAIPYYPVISNIVKQNQSLFNSIELPLMLEAVKLLDRFSANQTIQRPIVSQPTVIQNIIQQPLTVSVTPVVPGQNLLQLSTNIQSSYPGTNLHLIPPTVVCVDTEGRKKLKFKGTVGDWHGDGSKNVYIGRVVPRSKGTFESFWHNPYKIADIKKEGYDENTARNVSIQRYEQYLLSRPDMIARLPELSNKTLGCWCHPETCHGDVLVKFFNHYVLGVPQSLEQPLNLNVIQSAEQTVPSGQINTQQVPLGNIGKMNYKGSFGGTTTYSGYTVDVMKSALQKYIRRNMTMKALVSAFELYRLKELEQGDRFVTNLYNRLAVISCEDIGPANLNLVGMTLDLVLNDNREASKLATIVQLLSESEKTRMMSHIYKVYIDSKGREYAKSLGLIVDDTFQAEDNEFIQAHYAEFFVNGDPLELAQYAMVFYKRLLENNITAFIWLNYYMIASKDKEIVQRANTGSVYIAKQKIKKDGTISFSKNKHRSDPMVILWLVLAKILDSDICYKLSQAYFTLTENRPFLTTAILSALYKIPYVKTDISSMSMLWEHNQALQSLLQGNYTFEITPEESEYIIDKHTSKGSAAGKDRTDFVTKGTVVIPQSKTYFNETLEYIYRTFKE